MAFYMPPLPAGQSIGRNIKIMAQLIQLGDSIKPANKTEYLVVEAIAVKAGDHPHRIFLMSDGTTYKAFDGAYIWYRPAQG